ncbi:MULTISPECIES: DUF2971 domain-containing protein [Pseudomonas]|jgi:hypothetical protein|uniref:DUF2971 domain-containing protein n=1 Tax=Pseudomonas extremorientalis TaxID=169669 RepID=A0A1S2TN45_9PSED|nr:MULTISPECIES: DUF2971 domain-containing protein [Pseudomonas]KAB0522037.1 DUF2971 domain-containing protein [Pseudomonas extremorientalis]OIN10781.1 DUF2971 domain-containing protein [Pseudomonas extremorientalis]
MLRTVFDESIDANEHLWRYFRPDRFLEMINQGCLYFASARQFQDPFEGATAVLPPGSIHDPRFLPQNEGGERAFEQLRRLTKICCWHRAAYESDAMWQLYAAAWKGVAIRTSPARLAKAIKPFKLREDYADETLWSGNVRYLDLLKERLRVNVLERFMYKHKAFSWEQEFRLMISLRLAEEFGVKVPESGIKVAVDVCLLIDRIYLGPELSIDDTQAIRLAAESAGLGDRVRVSSMLGTPRYT